MIEHVVVITAYTLHTHGRITILSFFFLSFFPAALASGTSAVPIVWSCPPRMEEGTVEWRPVR